MVAVVKKNYMTATGSSFRVLGVHKASHFPYENIQMQTGLENLLSDKNFCLYNSSFYRYQKHLRWKANILIWYTKPNWQKKRVANWVFPRTRSLVKVKSNSAYFHFAESKKYRLCPFQVHHQLGPHANSVTEYWKRLRKRSMYTSGYLDKRIRGLHKNFSSVLGMRILALVGAYARVKSVDLRFSYTCLSLRKGLKQARTQLPYYKRAVFFRPSIQVFSFLFRKPGPPQILAHFIKHQIQAHYRDQRKMRWFLRFLKEVLTFYWKKDYPGILGLRVQINGRLKRRDRKFNLKRTYEVGKLGLSGYDSQIQYDETLAFTKNGALQIRVWINYVPCSRRSKKIKSI